MLESVREGDDDQHALLSSQIVLDKSQRWKFWSCNFGNIVWFCAFANFINSANRVIMPIAIGKLAAENNFNFMQQGWILSAFPAGYISSQIIGSCAGSQLGGQRLLLFVVLFWSLSTLLVPLFAASFHLIILTRVVLGLGEGLGLSTMYHIIAQTVPLPKRPSAFSFMSAMGAIGQSAAAIICPHLVWELSFYIFGSFGIFWCLLWLRTDIEIPASNPADQQLLCQKLHNPLRSWKRFLEAPFLAIYLAHFCMNWNAYIIMHWLPTYLFITFRADPTGISLAAFPYIANSLCSAVVGRVVDDLISRKRLTLLRARICATVFGLVLPAVLLIAFALVKHLLLAILLVSLSMGTLALNTAGHLSNHADVAPKYADISFVVSNTIATLPGMMVGPLTARLVTDSSGRWWPTFVLAAAMNFVGAAVYANYATVKQLI